MNINQILHQGTNSSNSLSMGSTEATAINSSYVLLILLRPTDETIQHNGDQLNAKMTDTTPQVIQLDNETLIRTSTPFETGQIDEFSLGISPIKSSPTKRKFIKVNRKKKYGDAVINVLTPEQIKRKFEEGDFQKNKKQVLSFF